MVQKKLEKKEQRTEGTSRKKQQNGRLKPRNKNNYIKCILIHKTIASDRMSNWIKEGKRYNYKRHSGSIKTQIVEGKRIEPDTPCKCKLAKASMAIIISDKMEFKTRGITGNKEGYLIVINGSTH